MIEKIGPTVYNGQSVYNTGAGGGGGSNVLIFKTDCETFDGNKDIPILGTCINFNNLGNGFTCVHGSNFYSFKTTQNAVETNNIWLGSPMLIYGLKTKTKIRCSLSQNKNKTMQILMPLPLRITFFDPGLSYHCSNMVGVSLNMTSNNYTTNIIDKFEIIGVDKYFGFDELVLNRIYEFTITFDNGVVRIECNNKFVEFNYDFFNNTSPSWVGSLYGGIKIRQNSNTADSSEEVRIYSIETIIE